MNFLSGVIGASQNGRLPSGYSLLLDPADTRSYPGSGTSWFDLSGNNNTATLVNGMSWNAAGYMTLDGTNQYASIIHNATISPTTAYAILMWVYPTNLDGTNPRWLMSKRTSSSSGNFASFFYSGNAIYGDVPARPGRFNGNTGIGVNNTWQHIAIVWRGSQQTIGFFKNGILDVRRTGTLSSITSTANNLLLGFADGGTTYFGGRFGLSAFYRNVELSDLQVLQAYNAHRSRYGL